MSAILGFVVGVVASLSANYMSPPFSRFIDSVFGRLFHLLNPDRFDLTGTWSHQFKEPMPGNPTEWRDENEKVPLKHLGATVVGIRKTTVEPREFQYKLKVQHNLIFGSYVKVGEKGNITGSGMIQLIVSPDRLKMRGQATWFDRDTEQIESSQTEWTKIS